MRRRLPGMLVMALWLAFVPAAGADLTRADTPMHISPGTGGIHTRFKLSFAIPEATGISRDLSRGDSVVVDGPRHSGCLGHAEVALPLAAAKHVFHLTLSPAAPDGWCRGTFSGRLIETEAVVCIPGPVKGAVMCPDIAIAPRTIGVFKFRVVEHVRHHNVRP